MFRQEILLKEFRQIISCPTKNFLEELDSERSLDLFFVLFKIFY